LSISDGHAQHLAQPLVIGLGIGVAISDGHFLPRCGGNGATAAAAA